MRFRERAERWREAQGVGASVVLERLGHPASHRNTYRRWETGESRMPAEVVTSLLVLMEAGPAVALAALDEYTGGWGEALIAARRSEHWPVVLEMTATALESTRMDMDKWVAMAAGCES